MIERALGAMFVSQPTPEKTADDRESDCQEKNAVRFLFPANFVQPGTHRDVHGIKRHHADHGIDRISIKNATDQKSEQPGILTAGAQCLDRLRRGIAYHLEIDWPRIGIASFFHKEKTRNGKDQEQNCDQQKNQRLAMASEKIGQRLHSRAIALRPDSNCHRNIRAEIADPDSDSTNAPAVFFGADLGQHRIVKLNARLIADVRDDEKESRPIKAEAREQGRETNRNHRAPDQEWHSPARPIRHRPKQRRSEKDQCHGKRHDCAVARVRPLFANRVANPERKIQRDHAH